jgi:head-tail adaptor
VTALVHTIVVERAAVTIGASGAPAETWTALVTLRAAVSQEATAERLADRGASDETSVVFRTRFFPGITPADRILFGGRPFNLLEVTPIGRDRWLDLRAIAVEP